LKINYFLPATQGRIFARSRLLRIGSTLCVGSVDLTDEHRRTIGTAIVTYMILDAPAVAPGDRRPPRPPRRKP
jgi:acyl-coenzyme A thioesterase PaaI-like protein